MSKKFQITFIQNYTYYIEAEDEDTAFDKAEEEFHEEVCSPNFNHDYDSVEIEEIGNF